MKIYVKGLLTGFVAETAGSRKFFEDYYVEYMPSLAPDGSTRLHPQKSYVEIDAETLEDLKAYSLKYNAHIIVTPLFQILFDFYKNEDVYEDR